MKNIFDASNFTLKSLPAGAFVVTGGKNKNAMTIGWGMIGVMWSRPVFIAPIRISRYTRQCLEQEKGFTVCVPNVGEMAGALRVCGTLSGRNVDKFDRAKLSAKPAKLLKEGLIIDGCKNYYECKIVAKCELSEQLLDKELLDKWYKEGDLHTLYFGEIIAEY